jgi:hypothetical protein
MAKKTRCRFRATASSSEHRTRRTGQLGVCRQSRCGSRIRLRLIRLSRDNLFGSEERLSKM